MIWNRFVFLFFIAVFGLFLPDVAKAGDISDVICTVITGISGSTGKAIATVAVAAMGIGALINKISWNMVFVTGFGVALIFGASSVATTLGGSSVSCSSSAAASSFSCSGATPSGNIFAVAKSNKDDTVSSTTSTYDTATIDSCYATSNGTNNIPIFATMMCVFKSTIGDIMSNMYCSFSDYIKSPLASLLTLFVTLFGVMMITGMTNTKVKDFAIVLFKIALIWTFATGGDWAIGVGYKFFMAIAQEGSDIAMSAMPHLSGGTVSTLTAPDTVLAGIFNDTVSITNAQSPMTTALQYVPASCLVDAAFFALLFIIFLPGFILFFIMMILQYIGMFAKAMLNYLTALVLISFLFILAPLFISFALFRTTAPIFEKWLQFLGTFAIQMIVMFGFLAMLSLIPMLDFYIEVLKLLKDYDTTFGIWHFTLPMKGCGFCDYKIDNNASSFLTQMSSGGTSGNQISCVDHTGSTAQQADSSGYLLSTDGKYWVTQIWTLMEHHDLVMFLVVQIIALYLIGKVMEDMLNHADKLAKALGSVGGNSGIASFSAKAGQGAAVGYVGLESIAASYHGLRNGIIDSGSGFISKFRNGFNDDENRTFGRRVWAGFKETANIPITKRVAAGLVGAKEGLLHGAEERNNFMSSLISGEEASLAVQAQIKRWEVDKKKAERAKIAADVDYKKAQELTEKNKKDMDFAESQLKNAITAEQIALAQTLYDKAKANYQAAKDNEASNRASKAKSEREYNNINYKIERKRRSVNWHKGFIGDDYTESSLRAISTMGNTETTQRLQELHTEYVEKKKYGRILRRNPDNLYYGILKMPKDVPADIKNDADYANESESKESAPADETALATPQAAPPSGGNSGGGTTT